MFKSLKAAVGLGGSKSKGEKFSSPSDMVRNKFGSKTGNREVGQTMGRSGGFKEAKDNVFGGMKGDSRKVHFGDRNLPLSGSANPEHREIAKRQAPHMRPKSNVNDKKGGMLRRIFDSSPFNRANKVLNQAGRSR